MRWKKPRDKNCLDKESNMNSRDRVMAVFAGEVPDRVPRWCGSSVEFWEKSKEQLCLDDEELSVRFGDDFRRVFAEYRTPEYDLPEGATYRTIFGIDRTGIGYGQPLSHPLAEATIEDVHDYAWPDPDWVDVSAIAETAKSWDGKYAILGGDWSPFWHDAIDLIGMENLYMKMYDQPELVDAVMTHMVDFYFESSKKIFDAAADDIDIFFMGNDFGSQNGPLMSPDMFRRFILPHTQRLADLGHSYGLKVQLHCCGGILPLIPLLIEAGIDGLHSLQPDCHGMDLAELKRQFGDKIVMNGGIDSKRILIDGDVDFVTQQTHEVLKIMMAGGGYIAGASHDTILEETPVENVLAMFDAIEEYGIYG